MRRTRLIENTCPIEINAILSVGRGHHKPFSQTHTEHKYIVIFVEYATKWVETFPIPRNSR